MKHIDIILEQMRQGGTITVGSSRCHTDYGHDAEGFYAESFDEGRIERHRIDEAQVRAMHGRDPSQFVGLLRRYGWQQVRAALESDDLPAVCRALRWIERRCDQHDHARVWLAALDEAPPDAAVAEMVREKARGNVLWHAIMAGFAWQSTAETAARAEWLLDRLVERISGIKGQARLRARFAAMTAKT